MIISGVIITLRFLVLLVLAMAKIGRKIGTSKKKAGKFQFPAEFS
jgi:Na+-transporting methylmalonyl-CoA/oxaloacetate decarboxylase gamma subunit